MGLAQQAMLREALANAQLDPQRIGYVEDTWHRNGARRSGEVEALAAVVEMDRQPCYLGAVKANIGHLEAAAGVVGLLKTVLVLQHESHTAAGALHEDSIRTSSFEGTRFSIPTALVPGPGAKHRVVQV